MKDVNKVCEMLKFDNELVVKFFVAFSRFEYALKRAGYLNNKKNYIEIEWDRFASTFAKRFNPEKTIELKNAVEYLKQHPPKKQAIKDGVLAWSESKPQGEDSILKMLLVYVRRVRNNLFHGGKFPGQPIHDPARDQLLLTNSLIILEACLKLDSSIRNFFLSENE